MTAAAQSVSYYFKHDRACFTFNLYTGSNTRLFPLKWVLHRKEIIPYLCNAGNNCLTSNEGSIVTNIIDVLDDLLRVHVVRVCRWKIEQVQS